MSSYDYWRDVAANWGTLYFGAIFLAVLIYALWPSKKETFDHAAQIPLIED